MIRLVVAAALVISITGCPDKSSSAGAGGGVNAGATADVPAWAGAGGKVIVDGHAKFQAAGSIKGVSSRSLAVDAASAKARARLLRVVQGLPVDGTEPVEGSLSGAVIAETFVAKDGTAYALAEMDVP